MIGTEKASDIKAKLRAAAGKSDAELLAWFNDEVSRARQMPIGSDTAIESLNLLLNALQNEPKRKPRAKPKRRKAISKK